MKKIIIIFLSAIIATASCATGEASKTDIQTLPDGTVNLNNALGDFSAYIGERLTDAALTAVAVTDTPVQRLANYIVDELSAMLLNSAGLRMVSRQDFERVLAEQNIQTALNFNDDTAARIGHNLGWQTVIFGAVEPLQEVYRLSLRAVDVETGELLGSNSYLLNGSDPILINIINPNISIQHLSERDAILQPFSGRLNNFPLTVTTSKTVYYDNEELFITLLAGEDCYFVVYHLDIENNMQVIYPNLWDKDTNFLRAGVRRIIPENASFALHAPYGEERILVYASPRPFAINENQYSKRPVTSEMLASPEALWRLNSDEDASKGMSVVPRGATAQAIYSILPGK